jgi:hypothetical protein
MPQKEAASSMKRPKETQPFNRRAEPVLGLSFRLLWQVALEAEAPLLPDPPTNQSAGPFSHREIPTHHDGFAGCAY